MLPKDTSAHRLGQIRVKPLTFRLVDNPLYRLSHGNEVFAYYWITGFRKSLMLVESNPPQSHASHSLFLCNISLVSSFISTKQKSREESISPIN